MFQTWPVTRNIFGPNPSKTIFTLCYITFFEELQYSKANPGLPQTYGVESSSWPLKTVNCNGKVLHLNTSGSPMEILCDVLGRMEWYRFKTLTFFKTESAVDISWKLINTFRIAIRFAKNMVISSKIWKPFCIHISHVLPVMFVCL